LARVVLLTVVGLVIATAAGCSGGGDVPAVASLDAPAAKACEEFAPIGGQVRRGELEGPALYRALQDVWNIASQSENTDVVEASRSTLTAAIQDDRQALNSAVTQLQQACALPFS
jgi:hypothetical protein